MSGVWLVLSGIRPAGWDEWNDPGYWREFRDVGAVAAVVVCKRLQGEGGGRLEAAAATMRKGKEGKGRRTKRALVVEGTPEV